MLTGCASYPEGPVTTGKQLILTMKVQGRINPYDSLTPGVQRHYFIAIDNDGDPETGPWAAIAQPYGGTGWVTSKDAARSVGLTSYIQYDSTSPEGYIVGVLPGTYFQNETAPQPPILFELPAPDTMRVTIDFSQIATSTIPADEIKQLDINFITTNAIPKSGEFAPGRIWDGLGPTGQNYVKIDTTRDNPYYGYNSDGPPVSDPDLKIVYWSIEVRTISFK
jgi:hypothetical protein